ncbi:hypothetical protein TRM7615_04944 [Falsiruegeria mediterranea M17]|uniref:Uncharacterized protein n=1 Tax=Falsiruegeria mediterranea M17 TaxID=1200281 RepID=A0A2R8CG49_9RHOB|nr:hypothetical protein TRM7615_04944 [Falsiruegeria mediterranea M17]
MIGVLSEFRWTYKVTNYFNRREMLALRKNIKTSRPLRKQIHASDLRLQFEGPETAVPSVDPDFELVVGVMEQIAGQQLVRTIRKPTATLSL